MHKKFLLAVLALITVFSQTLGAHDIYYKSVSSSEGFPATITSIYAQDRGYVWVGTDDGLVRLDNSGYRIYSAGESEGSLPGNHIFGVTEDAEHRIWINTDKGTVFYNPDSDSFGHYKIDSDASETELLSRPIFSTFCVEDGIYGGGENCLYKYSYADGIVRIEKSFSPLIPFTVDYIYPGQNNNLLLLNKAQGFLIYYPGTGQIYTPDFNILDNRCVFIDSKGRIWRSQYNRGLECFDIRGDLLARYTTANSDLTSDIILDIAERQGEIWAGTDGGGINIINPETGDFRILSHGTHQICNLPDNSIAALHCAPNGDVWAGSREGGLLLLSETYMRSFHVRPSGIRSENTSDKINCICKDTGSDLLWLGTHGSGLLSFNPVNESIFSYNATEGMEVVSMVPLPGGNILLSCFGKGLYVFDTHTHKLSEFSLHSSTFDEWVKYSSGEVNLSLDFEGNVMVFANQVYLYDPRSGRITSPELSMPHDPKHHVMAVTDGSGTYFICEDNLTIWDPHTGSVDLAVQAGDGEVFNCAAMDSRGKIWIGTNNGLTAYDTNTRESSTISSDTFKDARSIICSPDGKVWIGGSSKLYAYLPDKDSFVLFDEFDGAFENSFSAKAVLNNDGRIVMGGRNGFTIIDPSQTFDDIDVPEFILSDFIVDGERADLSGSIRIPYTHKNVQVNIFAKEDDILRSKLYMFRIKGPRGTNDITSDRPSFQVGFNVPGNYSIYASCTLKDGSWSEFQKVGTYHVSRPWYLKWWFIACVFALFLLLLYILKRFEDTVSREKQKTQSTEDHVKFLLNVSHELKTPLTLIISPLGRVIEETDPQSPNYNRLKNIYRQAQRMRTLILTVLSAHKIEEGSATLDAEPVDYNAWVEGIVSNFDDEAQIHGIVIRRAMHPAVGTVNIDGMKLENVLTNIMINAFKHSPNDTEIEVGTKIIHETNMVRVYVKDRGPGLQGVDGSKLFSRYYQGITEKTGSGMGLAYAKTIVDLHNGTIEAENNADGCGATFYFDIPM